MKLYLTLFLYEDSDGEYDDEADDVLCDMRSNSAKFSDHDIEDFCDKESRFTDYSMSSSVMRRNAGLTLVDDRFEQVFIPSRILRLRKKEREETLVGILNDSKVFRTFLDLFKL